MIIALRFAITYDTPTGTRTLSSSTRNVAVLVADQVDAGDDTRAPLGARCPTPAGGNAGGGDQLARDHAVGEHPPLAVDVGEERLQRPDPLRHAGLDRLPLGRRDDPGHQVERERPLHPADVEGDARLGVILRQ